MSGRKILGILLLAGGIFALAQGGFSFTKKKDTVNLGPLELSASKKEHVELPPWLGIAGVVAGAALLLVPGRK